MPTSKTLSKGVSDPQHAAFLEACAKVGLEKSAGLDAAFKLFCEAQGVQWPETGKHGGLREGAFKKKA